MRLNSMTSGKTWMSVTTRLMLAAFLAMTGPLDAFAQAAAPTPGRSGSGIGDRGESARSPVSRPETEAITRNIDSIRIECARIDPLYRIDCVRQGLNNVARRIPADGEYGPARSLILRASRTLGAIVDRNADNKAVPMQSQPGTNPRFRAKRRYTAVKKGNLGAALRQANAVVEELATELLRASENSQKRQQHYQRIAAAVGSMKTLLRS
jgi:hypothetical protein